MNDLQAWMSSRLKVDIQDVLSCIPPHIDDAVADICLALKNADVIYPNRIDEMIASGMLSHRDAIIALMKRNKGELAVTQYAAIVYPFLNLPPEHSNDLDYEVLQSCLRYSFWPSEPVYDIKVKNEIVGQMRQIWMHLSHEECPLSDYELRYGEIPYQGMYTRFV